jgi:hypothetical protein
MMFKSTNTSKIVITVYKVVCVVLCIVLFMLLMKEVMEKFYKGTTTTGIKFRNEESMQLPCITFCPVAAFKQWGMHYEEKSYLENTYRLEDIFQNETLQKITNKTNFFIKEFHTLFLGTCYTLCSLTYVGEKEEVRISFRYLGDIKIVVHGIGEEFWLFAWFMFPSEVGNTQLTIKEDVKIVGATVTIKKTETFLLNQEHSPCVPDLEKESINQSYYRFLECSKDKIWQNISQNVSCTIFGFDEFYNNSGLPMCKNESTAGTTFEALYYEITKFVTNPAKFGCPMPCRRIKYSLNTVYAHKNSWFTPTDKAMIINNSFIFVYCFESLQVEERTETLVT